MNNTNLIGRITKDLNLKQHGERPFVSFTLAIDNYNAKTGEKGADFIPVKVWGKQAENLCEYCTKGSKIAVTGRLKSGSYDKDGVTVYTLDVIASSIEFLSQKGTDITKPEGNISSFDEANLDMPF